MLQLICVIINSSCQKSNSTDAQDALTQAQSHTATASLAQVAQTLVRNMWAQAPAEIKKQTSPLQAAMQTQRQLACGHPAQSHMALFK